MPHLSYLVLFLNGLPFFLLKSIDINECAMGTSDCSQICENTNGSYLCDCYYGYQLLSNNKTCRHASKATVLLILINMLPTATDLNVSVLILSRFKLRIAANSERKNNYIIIKFNFQTTEVLFSAIVICNT